MTIIIEKSEDCPNCGEVKRWLYDAQICAACEYGDQYAASRRGRQATTSIECPQCGGEGVLDSCFEDTCVCLDPPCQTVRCDACQGKGAITEPSP